MMMLTLTLIGRDANVDGMMLLLMLMLMLMLMRMQMRRHTTRGKQ
jgi:hypothetical protein